MEMRKSCTISMSKLCNVKYLFSYLCAFICCSNWIPLIYWQLLIPLNKRNIHWLLGHVDLKERRMTTYDSDKAALCYHICYGLHAFMSSGWIL